MTCECGAAEGQTSFYLFLLFAAEIIVLRVVNLPVSLTLYNFGFHDEGGSLTVHYLVAQGFRPAIDFGYPYGLFAILIGNCFPATPYWFEAVILVAALLMARGLAKLAAELEIGVNGVTLMVCAMPFAIAGLGWSYAHALEGILLCNALAEHASGNRGKALALTAAACLSKPALGYFYGLLLLILIVGNRLRQRQQLWSSVSDLIPAVVSTGVLLFILATKYGVVSLAQTIVPSGGAATYRYLNNGFFRAGSGLYYFPGVRPGFYLGTVAGLYLIGNLCLFIVAIRRALKFASSEFRIQDEMVVTCATLQAVFIFVAYGGAGSWTSSAYILIMGLASMTKGGPSATRLGWVLALMAVLANKSTATTTYRAWLTSQPTSATDGLWAPPEEAIEWSQVRQMAKGHKTAVIS
jgi:hypothetical protein